MFPVAFSARYNTVPIPSDPTSNNNNSNDIPIEITRSHPNKSIPTSGPVPILSIEPLAIGCSDGAVRFFSRTEGRVVKSVRGPNGRSDPVVGPVSIDPRTRVVPLVVEEDAGEGE